MIGAVPIFNIVFLGIFVGLFGIVPAYIIIKDIYRVYIQSEVSKE